MYENTYRSGLKFYRSISDKNCPGSIQALPGQKFFGRSVFALLPPDGQLFQTGQRVLDRRQQEQHNGQDHFRQNVAHVVCGGRPDRGDVRSGAAGNIGGVEDVAGDLVNQQSAQDADDIAFEQPVFGFPEKAGQAQSAEGQRIVQNHLQRMHHIGPGNELQDAVGKGGDQAGSRSVPIADQADDQHGKQRDGSAVGQAGQFENDRDYRGQRDGHGAENEFSGGKSFGVV